MSKVSSHKLTPGYDDWQMSNVLFRNIPYDFVWELPAWCMYNSLILVSVACQELDPKASHSRVPGIIRIHLSWVKALVRGNLQFNWSLRQWDAESTLKQIDYCNGELQLDWIGALQGWSTFARLMLHTVPTFTVSANPLKLCEHRRHVFKRNSFRWFETKQELEWQSQVKSLFNPCHFSHHLDEGAQQNSALSRRWGAMGRWRVGVFNSRGQKVREGRGHWHCKQVMEPGTHVWLPFSVIEGLAEKGRHSQEGKITNYVKNWQDMQHYLIRPHHVTSHPPLLNMQKAPGPWLSDVRFFFQV